MGEQTKSAAPSESKAPQPTTNAPSGAPTKPKSQAEADSALRKLAAEFAPAEPAPPSENAPTGDKPTGKAKPKDIRELAERLGVEVSELYTVEIPSSREGEKPYTLGTLKDHMVERDDFTVKSLAFEESKRQTEADLIRSQQELAELISALPPDAVKPEVREAARKKHGAFVQQERQKTLQVIPEWRDEKTRENEIADLTQHLGAYGFPNNFLLSVQDHRLFKYFRDNMKREQQLRAALAKIVAVKPETPNRSQSNTRSGNGSTSAAPQRMTRQDRQVQRMLDEFNGKGT